MNSIQRGKPRVELGDVRLSLHGKDADPRRAERIARLLLAYLGELIEREQVLVRRKPEQAPGEKVRRGQWRNKS